MNEVANFVDGNLPASRSSIMALQAAMLSMSDQLDPDDLTSHYFSPGVYVRQMDIAEGGVVVGKTHRHDHMVILMKGKVKVSTEFGSEIIIAPKVWNCPAGSKRAICAMEDSQWLNIHENPTNTKDLSVIEGNVIAPDYKTYDEVVRSTGLSHEKINEIVQDESDQVPFDTDYPVNIRDSSIHGVGMFANYGFSVDELICPMRVGDKRTPAGRYINHGTPPNIRIEKFGGDIWAKAITAIPRGGELIIDYADNRRRL